MPLSRLTLPVTPFQQNCSLVRCARRRTAALIDPGGELPRLRAAVTQHRLALQAIWLNHAHIDHAGSTGRTDLPGGDPEQLIDGIRTRPWPMGDATVFVPGHGPESSFGPEKRSNPCVGDRP